MVVGGYCNGGLHCVLCVRADNSVAYIIWHEVALDTGSFFCLFGPSSSDNQLSRVPRIEWKCMFLVNIYIYIYIRQLQEIVSCFWLFTMRYYSFFVVYAKGVILVYLQYRIVAFVSLLH